MFLHNNVKTCIGAQNCVTKTLTMIMRKIPPIVPTIGPMRTLLDTGWDVSAGAAEVVTDEGSADEGVAVVVKKFDIVLYKEWLYATATE